MIKYIPTVPATQEAGIEVLLEPQSSKPSSIWATKRKPVSKMFFLNVLCDM